MVEHYRVAYETVSSRQSYIRRTLLSASCRRCTQVSTATQKTHRNKTRLSHSRRRSRALIGDSNSCVAETITTDGKMSLTRWSADLCLHL